MRTRTKLGVCVYVGLLVLNAGVVVVSRVREKRSVEVRFVQYTPDGGALLHITNSLRSSVDFVPMNGALLSSQDHPEGFMLMERLGAGRDTQLIAWGPGGKAAPPFQVSLRFSPLGTPSKLRQRIEVLLSKVGMNIANTGFVATVTLPPRPGDPFLGPTNQATP